MVGIPPIFTSDGKTKWSHLYISPVELATNSNGRVIASFLIQFEISWFSKAVWIFCHENGMEEWSAFHQYPQLRLRTSGPISILAQSS
jgi:hypothetical protein